MLRISCRQFTDCLTDTSAHSHKSLYNPMQSDLASVLVCIMHRTVLNHPDADLSDIEANLIAPHGSHHPLLCSHLAHCISLMIRQCGNKANAPPQAYSQTIVEILQGCGDFRRAHLGLSQQTAAGRGLSVPYLAAAARD